MRIKTLVLVLFLSVVLVLPAGAKTLRYAFQGDIKSFDPYALNETFTLGFLNNVFEGLIWRDSDLSIKPSLATKWEVMERDRQSVPMPQSAPDVSSANYVVPSDLKRHSIRQRPPSKSAEGFNQPTNTRYPLATDAITAVSACGTAATAL